MLVKKSQIWVYAFLVNVPPPLAFDRTNAPSTKGWQWGCQYQGGVHEGDIPGFSNTSTVDTDIKRGAPVHHPCNGGVRRDGGALGLQYNATTQCQAPKLYPPWTTHWHVDPKGNNHLIAKIHVWFKSFHRFMMYAHSIWDDRKKMKLPSKSGKKKLVTHCWPCVFFKPIQNPWDVRACSGPERHCSRGGYWGPHKAMFLQTKGGEKEQWACIGKEVCRFWPLIWKGALKLFWNGPSWLWDYKPYNASKVQMKI